MSVMKSLVGKDSGESGQRLLALSHVSMGLVNRYPHRVQGFVQYQHETAMNTAQVLAEQEAQRQAAKKANRQKNRKIAGSVAGAAVGFAAAPALGVSGLAGLSGGMSMGGSMAGGDVAGVAKGLGTFASSAAQINADGGKSSTGLSDQDINNLSTPYSKG